MKWWTGCVHWCVAVCAVRYDARPDARPPDVRQRPAGHASGSHSFLLLPRLPRNVRRRPAYRVPRGMYLQGLRLNCFKRQCFLSLLSLCLLSVETELLQKTVFSESPISLSAICYPWTCCSVVSDGFTFCA